MPDASQTERMQHAISLAVASARQCGGPFGAIVVKNGEVIAEGTNQVTSALDPTAHAEIVAIRAACAKLGTFSLAGCEVYASCEPCPMCLAALYWARVERVHYACTRADAARAGFDDELLYAELERAPGERKLPLVPLLRDEGLAAFEAWMAKGDRTPY
jgi:tRNA(Arg) A34 adenosine deaminase TadA